jgi:hypothetical protein
VAVKYLNNNDKKTDMIESLGQILRRGWETWKENLILCVPFILRLVIVVIIWVIPMMAVIMHNNGLIPATTAATGDALNEFLRRNAPIIFPIATLLVIACALVFSFFEAGAIQMSKEATEKGATNLESMWSAGRKKYLDMFFSYILTILIFAGATIVVSLPFMMAMVAPSLSALMFGLGIMIAFVVLLLAFLATALIPYALVIDDLGPVEAVKASVSFFRAHPQDVLPIFIGIGLISFVIGIVSLPLSLLPVVGSLVSPFINQVVIASISTLWLTRLYMGGTGKLPAEVKMVEVDGERTNKTN